MGEVVRLLVAQGAAGSLAVPAGVREVLERRLARLPQPCHALLTAAAVAGDPISEPLVAAVSGLDEATVVALLDMAARARLLAHDPVWASPFRFAHALVKEVLEDGLSAVERARLHQRVAEELEGCGDAEALADRLAYHWSHATGARARELAAAWSLRAARAAMAELGLEQAVVGTVLSVFILFLYAKAAGPLQGVDINWPRLLLAIVVTAVPLGLAAYSVARLVGDSRELLRRRRLGEWPFGTKPPPN